MKGCIIIIIIISSSSSSSSCSSNDISIILEVLWRFEGLGPTNPFFWFPTCFVVSLLSKPKNVALFSFNKLCAIGYCKIEIAIYADRGPTGAVLLEMEMRKACGVWYATGNRTVEV